jgi:hypothetical protein
MTEVGTCIFRGVRFGEEDRPDRVGPHVCVMSVSGQVSHPALRNKARCTSYMRQEDNI